MASSKISQLTSAPTPLGADLHALARGSSNRKLTTAALFQETLTRTDFETKRAANGLIAGRWYQVTNCGAGASPTRVVQVYATANNAFSRQVVEITATGPVWADWYDLAQQPATVTDARGNRTLYREAIVGDQPALNINNFLACSFDGASVPTLAGINDGTNLVDCQWRGACVGNWDEIFGRNSYFNTTSVFNPCGGVFNVLNCRFDGSVISKVNDENNPWTVELDNVALSNAELTLVGGNPITVANCRFENVRVTVTNGAAVDGLTVVGKLTDGEDTPTYVIDGTYQGQVLNQWAGHVVADRYAGTSTVRLRLNLWDDEGLPATYDKTMRTVFLIPNTVVGVYELPTIDVATPREISYVTEAVTHLFHAVELRQVEAAADKYTVTFQNTAASVTVDSEVLKYHGMTAKVGELRTPACFLALRSYYNPTLGAISWAATYGAHYD